MFKQEYFDMFRMGMLSDKQTNPKYIPKRSTVIKNKIKNAKGKRKGKKR
jgi:hypothetical protein